MAKITDYSQPSFVHWPFQNNRTALAPVNVPLLLVVPFVRDRITNAPINGSEVSNLKFFIEDAPGKAQVAGFQNAGIFVPDFERFSRLVSTLELSSVLIDLSPLPFFDKDTGELKDYADANAGDHFEYTLLRGLIDSSGPRDRIEYLPGANYYDLSPFVINTIELKPYGTYKFSWQCEYYHRVITPEGEIFCIDTESKRIARFSITMKHPGEIHQMMIEQTPSVYFDGSSLDQDSLVKFYRPFADVLQDLFDEQSLLVGVNFIEKIPAQFIPYLAYLIGWDLPYFPGSTDRIRRAVLKNGRRLQQLKGSERVIRELFEIFGYTIDIINLWYKKNGAGFVGPGEKQTDPSQQIDIQEICQTEVLLSEYQVNGFGGIEIPLLFRPDGDITIDGWFVDSDSTADDQLQGLIDIVNIDPEGLMSSVCPATTDGYLISQPLEEQVTGTPLGQSKILVTQKLGAVDHLQTKDAPLSKYGVHYDYDRNIITITFDHYIRFDSTKKLYVFATYKRNKIIVPPSLKDLRSNRFDIQILIDRASGEAPNSHLLDFLLDFIFKLKAFHSILRKIVFNVNVTDVYNVTDFCLGGRITQSPGTDAGELQTLPPVIPANIEGCNEDIFKRGFKDSDFALRNEIINGLKAEHKAWKNLDGSRDIPASLLPIVESMQRVPMSPSAEAFYGAPGVNYGSNAVYGDDQNCEYTQNGQERVIAKFDTNGIDKDFDNDVDDREKLCDETNNVLDNCFKGRVGQELQINRTLPLTEIVRCRPCGLMMGSGFYYHNPEKPKTLGEVTYGTYSYGKFEYNTSEIDTSKIENLGRGYLTDLIIRATANTEYIHYTASSSLTDNDVSTNDRAGIRRPSLDIDKDNLFFPGHRFISMNKLEDDFLHPVYTFRPWDYLFDPLKCPETIPQDFTLYGEDGYGVSLYNDDKITIDDLNPQIIIGSDGDEYITFNSITYKIYGNGLVPDVSTLGYHEDRDYFVTHSIFSSSPSDYVDHSDGSLTDATTFASTPLDSVCFSDGYDPIFTSANRDCACDGTSSFAAGSTDLEGMDYIDGYPSEFGRYLFDPDVTDYPRGEPDDVDLEYILGLPSEATTIPSELLFKLGSGIRATEPEARYYTPHRLDCGCAYFECEPTSPNVPHVNRCNIELYREEDGSLDLECDKVVVARNMVLEESYGTCTNLLGLYPASPALGYVTIANMLMFDPSKISITSIDNMPPSGEFCFVDAYGIVYEGSFETDNQRVDITYKTKDPRVWAETPQGYIQNNKVFRRGIVTSCRTISEIPADTDQPQFGKVLSHGCMQGIDTFQSTFGCGDKIPKDPFIHHLECGIIDELEITSTGTEGP